MSVKAPFVRAASIFFPHASSTCKVTGIETQHNQKSLYEEVVEVAKSHEATTLANRGIQQEQVNFTKKTTLENRSPDTLTAACF